MSRFKVSETAISGLYSVDRSLYHDSRGAFSRLFCPEEFHDLGWSSEVRQINLSVTEQVGSTRGMHLQLGKSAEHKLVMCLRGSVFDVGVDLRKGSSSFLSWHGEILSAQNLRALLIPPGCAHGFQVLESNTQLVYVHDQYYDANSETGIHPEDPVVSIAWPTEVRNLSMRDRNFEFIKEGFRGY